MNIKISSHQLNNLNQVNILLGKNGSGKSTLLKKMLTAKNDSGQDIYTEYVTPERGGFLKYEAGVDSQITNDVNYLPSSRKVNQINQFKQQTISRYQGLELEVLRDIQDKKIADDTSPAGSPKNTYSYFSKYIDAINSLLENIEIKTTRGAKSFKIYKKNTTDPIEPDNISSGESELISLAIECLYFQKTDSKGKDKVIFLDEPDVHLHPDLQVKFMRFIHALATEPGSEFKIVIATHSTAFLGALEDTTNVGIAFILPNQTTIDFKPITYIYKEFLPVFGAHPLSNIFNEAPVLLVEGEDDERIWQQAVRTSVGTIKVYPCVCGDVSKISIFENEIKTIINSVYDNAKAYSLRDRDDTSENDLTDNPPIIKHKLRCYSAENLLLADEVLVSLNLTWKNLKLKIDEWIIEKNGKTHPQLEDMKAFQLAKYDRKNLKIKTLRILLMGIMGSDKPWEVIVGQTIATLKWDSSTDFTKEGSIYNFLGKKLVEGLLPKK